MLPDESLSLALRLKLLLESLYTTYRYYSLGFLLALFIIGILLFLFKNGSEGVITLTGSRGSVEVLEASGSAQVKGETSEELIVEVSGEVQKPGVYKLPLGSRVDDLLNEADGVTEDADLEWMSKALNKATKLIDGQKLYIPPVNSSPDSQTPTVAPGLTSPNNTQPDSRTIISGASTGLININTAGTKELDGLPGVGPVYAQKITEQRPYSEVSELLKKKVIPKATYEKIKDKISVN